MAIENSLKSSDHPLIPGHTQLHFTLFYFISFQSISGLMGKGLLSHELMTVSPLGTRIAFAGAFKNVSQTHIPHLPTLLPVEIYLFINLLICICFLLQALCFLLVIHIKKNYAALICMLFKRSQWQNLYNRKFLPRQIL